MTAEKTREDAGTTAREGDPSDGTDARRGPRDDGDRAVAEREGERREGRTGVRSERDPREGDGDAIGILVVDDSDYMRSRLRSALDEESFEIVAEAPNGAWAVQKYKEHSEEVDVVLMDIVMRKANGVKATAAIKHLDGDARIVMCTSVGQRKKMKLAARAGADGYITKPFDDEEIVRAITTILDRDE